MKSWIDQLLLLLFKFKEIKQYHLTFEIRLS